MSESTVSEAELSGASFGHAGRRVTDLLRQMILSGELPPGSRIRQSELARRFDTSRIPVREALRRLEAEGLVEVIPNSGAWVAQLNVADAVEVYKIREAIEPLALGESMPRLTSEQVSLVRELETAVEGVTDVEEFLERDRAFHMATYAGAELPRLHSMIEHYWNAAQHYRRVFVRDAGPEEMALVEADHRLIVDAIVRVDPVAGESALRGHIRRTRLRLAALSDGFRGPASG